MTIRGKKRKRSGPASTALLEITERVGHLDNPQASSTQASPLLPNPNPPEDSPSVDIQVWHIPTEACVEGSNLI